MSHSVTTVNPYTLKNIKTYHVQSKEDVMKALDKLSHEAKLARSEWKQKSEGSNNTLSALYPAS